MLEGRFVEQGLDAFTRGLAAQWLLEQAWRVGALRVSLLGLRADGWRSVSPGLAGQLRQQHGTTEQQGIGAAGQALAQAAEGQFDIPGFQGGTAIEIEGESAGHIDRLPENQ